MVVSGLTKRILAYTQRYDLLPRGEKVLVGVSGGPDSVCLLHILAALQEGLGVSLHIAHLNHGLRGVEAEADAEYVAGLARSLNLPVTIERHDVATFKSKAHLSLEEAARGVRYNFFAKVAKEAGAFRVAVGHTADDQVETILLNLVRGAGVRGLRGMAPLSRWHSKRDSTLLIVRPILEISRLETMDYCKELGLSPRIDASNYSPAFLRNRVRNILPQLESLNPAMRKAFLRLGKAAGEAVDLLDTEVAKAWPQVIAQQGESSIKLNKKQLLQLPAAVQRHVLLVAWERLRDDPQDLEAIHIEEIVASLARPVGTMLNLPGGLEFWVEYDCVGLGFPDKGEGNCPFPPLSGEHSLNIPGETVLPGWRVAASILTQKEVPQKCLQPEKAADGNFIACMDFRLAGQKLWVRTRYDGDRFQPLGLSEAKKLQDFMVDAKIPRAWRDRVPLVCSPQGIAWVVGYRIADSVKLTERTEQVLRLEFKQLDMR